MTAAVEEISRAYGWELVGMPEAVPGAVSNTNLRANTTGGPYFVRLVPRERPEQNLRLEHAAIAWAAARGVPVAQPIPAPDGATYRLTGRWRAAVYRWIDGAPAGTTDDDIAARLGDIHGRVTAALEGFEHEALESRPAWDTAQTSETLSRVDDLIRYYPARTPEQAEAQGHLRRQLELVESVEARLASDFDWLACRPAHGDVHRRNVLFDGQGSVAAVVDWGGVQLLPPAWEVYRALAFSDLLDAVLVRAYARAFAAHVAVTREEWEGAMELWWQSLLHDAWTYRAVFIEGNRAARPFLRHRAELIERFADAGFRRQLTEAVTDAAR